MADISLLTSEVALSVDILDFVSSNCSHFPSTNVIWVYIYIYICLTRQGNTTTIEAPFLGSGCSRVV
jgi:hypothetical protein